MLGKVVIGLLSQGTMNFYWHSARLPDPKELATFLADGSCRAQSLMKVSTSNGSIQTNCFEAIYIGVGYEPAKGAVRPSPARAAAAAATPECRLERSLN